VLVGWSGVRAAGYNTTSRAIVNFQPDATCYFIVLLIGPTCIQDYYIHDKEILNIILVYK